MQMTHTTGSAAFVLHLATHTQCKQARQFCDDHKKEAYGKLPDWTPITFFWGPVPHLQNIWGQYIIVQLEVNLDAVCVDGLENWYTTLLCSSRAVSRKLRTVYETVSCMQQLCIANLLLLVHFVMLPVISFINDGQLKATVSFTLVHKL